MERKCYRPGDWLVQCQRTGFIVYASETVVDAYGLRVRWQSADEVQPQDFVRGMPDNQTVPFALPEGTDVFLTDTEITADDL